MSKTTEFTNEPVPSIEPKLSSERDVKPSSGEEAPAVSPELKAQLISLFTEKGDLDDRMETIIDLIAANPSLVDVIVEDKEGNTALHCAANYRLFGLVKFLIDKYPEKINTVNENNQTPLRIATSAANYKIAKYLIDHNATMDDQSCQFMLRTAIKRDELETVKSMLEKGAVVNELVWRIVNRCKDSDSYPNLEEITQLLKGAQAKQEAQSIAKKTLDAVIGLVIKKKQEEELRKKLEAEALKKAVEMEALKKAKEAEELRKKQEQELFEKKYLEFMKAIYAFDLEKIKELVNIFPDLFKRALIITIKQKDGSPLGRSALSYLMDNFNVNKKASDIAKFLIQEGSKHEMNLVGYQGTDQMTILKQALFGGKMEIATMLAESGQYSIEQIFQSVCTFGNGYDLLKNLLSKPETVAKLIAAQEIIQPIFFGSFSANKGKFDDRLQEIYEILNKHGYKFPGLERPIIYDISMPQDSIDPLIVKILQNTATDIKDENIKHLLADLLVEGLEIVLQHQHIRDIFKIVVDKKIPSFIYSDYKGINCNLKVITHAQYGIYDKIISIFNSGTKLNLLTEMLEAKNSGEQEQYEKLKLNYLKHFINIFTHENTHAGIDGAFANDAKMFAEGDAKQQEKLTKFLQDYTEKENKEASILDAIKVKMFLEIVFYPKGFQTQELPSYLYGNLAAELVRQKYQTEEGKIESQSFHQDLEKCKEFVALCSQTFQEKCHGGEVVDPASLYYHFCGAEPALEVAGGHVHLEE